MDFYLRTNTARIAFRSQLLGMPSWSSCEGFDHVNFFFGSVLAVGVEGNFDVLGLLLTRTGGGEGFLAATLASALGFISC